MRKSQFLFQLQTEREHWELLLNYVGAVRLGIGGVSGAWSVRDIVAYIMMREQYLADRLHEIRHGEPLPACKTQDEVDTFFEDYGYPDFESPLVSAHTANEWVVQKYKNTPFNDLVTLELHAYYAIYENLQALPEDQVHKYHLVDRVQRYTIDHYHQHSIDIRKRFKATIKR